MKQYDYFQISCSWINKAANLSAEDKTKYINAIMEYETQGHIPTMSESISRIFLAIKPEIDAYLKKREKLAAASRKNGLKGGRPRKYPKHPLETNGNSKTNPPDNDNRPKPYGITPPDKRYYSSPNNCGTMALQRPMPAIMTQTGCPLQNPTDSFLRDEILLGFQNLQNLINQYFGLFGIDAEEPCGNLRKTLSFFLSPYNPLFINYTERKTKDVLTYIPNKVEKMQNHSEQNPDSPTLFPNDTGTEKKEKRSAQKEKRAAIDYDGIMERFNSEFAGKLQRVTIMTKARKAAIAARLSECGADSLDTVFKNIADSKFLIGNNDRNWKADFDWIFRPNNYVKILEGNYANRTQVSKDSRMFFDRQVDHYTDDEI